MAQYIDKDALIAEIYALLDDKFQCNSYDETTGFQNALILIKKFLNTLEVKEVQEEPVSEDLEEAARKIATRHSHISGDIYYANDAWFFKKGAQWKEKNILKAADGEDLPEYDRGVIVLTQHYPLEGSEFAVSFAHRPNPKGWDGKGLISGKIEHYTPKTYDKGGWNIPDVIFWLDFDFSKSMQNKE